MPSQENQPQAKRQKIDSECSSSTLWNLFNEMSDAEEANSEGLNSGHTAEMMVMYLKEHIQPRHTDPLECTCIYPWGRCVGKGSHFWVRQSKSMNMFTCVSMCECARVVKQVLGIELVKRHWYKKYKMLEKCVCVYIYLHVFGVHVFVCVQCTCMCMCGVYV